MIPERMSGDILKPAVSAERARKSFGATRALDAVDFDVMPGEIHALVGENGAGKSTLVRLLAGIHRPDTGRIAIAGRACHFAGPRDAIAAGIVTIPQELRLVPSLSIAENIALGDLPLKYVFGLPVVDREQMRADARVALARFDFTPDLDAPVGRIGFAEQQIVALAKAFRRRCAVLILDEPTAALENREIERLFAVLARLKAEGTAIIYVSHRLDEIVALADRCTVLRDGRIAALARRGEFSVADLVRAMSGRAAEIPLASTHPGDIFVQDAEPRPDAVQLRQGEVLGLAGLLGSGTERVLARLFGLSRPAGLVCIGGKECRLANPIRSIEAGIGMVPGTRRLGLIMNLSVRDNILLANLDRLQRFGIIDRSAGDRLVAELMDLLDIRPRRPDLRVSALSGGNQQKVILAKWLARRVEVLLLDEPTQGVDVSAKSQIHALVRDFAARGGVVLMSSSDLSELARSCDAVLAMHHGRITARFDRADGLEEARIHAALIG